MVAVYDLSPTLRHPRKTEIAPDIQGVCRRLRGERENSRKETESFPASAGSGRTGGEGGISRRCAQNKLLRDGPPPAVACDRSGHPAPNPRLQLRDPPVAPFSRTAEGRPGPVGGAEAALVKDNDWPPGKESRRPRACSPC
ncbi:hypothetical protein MTO96_052232 [Rhipicephalus appendiculatus]